jgi:hypothetical protein
MTTLNVTIEMDNAAFHDDGEEELRAILAKIPGKVYTYGPADASGNLLDSNGTTVGRFTVSSDPEGES